jgi:hypothetical protein
MELSSIRPIMINQESIEQTCWGCPSQWSGKTILGADVYIRLRHGLFCIEIDGEEVYRSYPHGYDGVMSTGEMMQYVADHSDEIIWI